ncbi:MAG: hypothetical protein J6P21_01480 [Clostridia bacterium]|nr:hypothetical protein [Clostridia bacterium]
MLNQELIDSEFGNKQSPKENKKDNNTSSQAPAQVSVPVQSQVPSNVPSGIGQYFNENVQLIEKIAKAAETQANKDWFKDLALCFVKNAPKYMSGNNAFSGFVSACEGNSKLLFKVYNCGDNFYFGFRVGWTVYLVYACYQGGKPCFRVRVDIDGISMQLFDVFWFINGDLRSPIALDVIDKDSENDFLGPFKEDVTFVVG